jgi:hypothetical protein
MMTVVLFLSALDTKTGRFWPYMIPCSATVADAAALAASLRFRFYGAGLFVIPAHGRHRLRLPALPRAAGRAISPVVGVAWRGGLCEAET